MRLARESEIREPEAIIARVQDAIADWPRWAEHSGISKSNAAAVQALHRLA
jgi:hypothetical protein